MAERVDRKARADEVAALAAEGLPGSEIARRLGISKQRVSQIAKANGIDIRRSYEWSHSRGKAPSVPRVRTGGVYVTENGNAVGAVSELLVAADLVARGWHVYLPVYRQRGHDIIAYTGNRFLTVEVRSGRLSPAGSLIYQRRTEVTKSDCFAVVVTGEPVRYIPDIPEVDEGKQPFDRRRIAVPSS